jgi:Zn-dependent peptidase ImmA (M78 family)
MTSIDFARRKARRGKKILPGNPNQWEFEHNGLDLREELAIGPDVALPVDRAFTLLRNVTVCALADVPIAEVRANYLRGEGSHAWSGMSVRLDDNSEVVVYNDSHPETRVRATLMEEFFHLRLGHARSVLRQLGDGTKSSRSFDGSIERAAFGSGAAALVPYSALRDRIGEGFSLSELAESFNVSEPLVRFRANVTRLGMKVR